MTGRNRFVQRWLVLAGIACSVSANAATITVDNLGDTDEDGNGCTLREAIQNANGDDLSGSMDCIAGSGIDLIQFSLSGTIFLGGALPGLTDADETQIDGAGRAITIAGNGSANIFTVVTSAALRLRNLNLTLGSANFGGCVNAAASSILAVERVNFTQCNANFGGAIYSLAALTVSESTFSGNTGFLSAGAISHGSLGVANIERSTFSGNVGPIDGGAILEQGGTLNVFSSTFSGNSADFTNGNGGAILLNSGTVTIRNSTFSGNISAAAGSALFVAVGTMTVYDSILANGVTGANCGGTITDGGGNLTWPAADTSCPGAIADPMLYPLGANGGATQTFDLQPGSAARDSADVTECPPVDQRGVTRPQGDECDIGAVEALPETGLIFWGDFEVFGTEAWSSAVP